MNSADILISILLHVKTAFLQTPDRYGHTFQILEAEKGSGEKKVIERTEAVHHILRIIKVEGPLIKDVTVGDNVTAN